MYLLMKNIFIPGPISQRDLGPDLDSALNFVKTMLSLWS